MILHDTEIHRRLSTLFPDHWEALEAENRVQPASVDLTVVGPLLRVLPPGGDPKTPIRPGYTDHQEVELTPGSRPDQPPHWVLQPGHLYLISTREKVAIPGDLAGQVGGRSSWGRVGLSVHVTAGFCDPGFMGDVTLELMVSGPCVDLRPGDSICQIVFFRTTGIVDRPYSKASKYHGQKGVTDSRDLSTGISR